MKKQAMAWYTVLVTGLAAATGTMFRWLQCQNVFTEGSNLPLQGAKTSALVLVYFALAAAALWYGGSKLPVKRISGDPQVALAPGHWLHSAALLICGLITAGGALLLFFTGEDVFLRLAGLALLPTAVALAFYPRLPEFGSLGNFLSAWPCLAFGYWLVAYYRYHAVNPILWNYGLEILAICGCLYATFRLSGWLFWRANARRAISGAALATLFCLAVLMDEVDAGTRMVLLGWGLGFLPLNWLLIDNMEELKEEKADDEKRA